MNRMGSLVVFVTSLLSSGCATSYVSNLGSYKEHAIDYHAAYSYKGELLLTYQADVTRFRGNSQKAERWAVVRVDVLLNYPAGGFTNGIPFKVYRSSLPEDIRKNAQEVPFVRASVDMQSWPPKVQPPDAVQVEAPLAIVIQSGGLYGQGASMGIRAQRADGGSVWIPGFVEPNGRPGMVTDVSGREGWATPFIGFGLVPAMLFDIVTGPIQAIYELNKWMKGITG